MLNLLDVFPPLYINFFMMRVFEYSTKLLDNQVIDQILK